MEDIEDLKNKIEEIWNAKQNNQSFDKNEVLKLANEVIEMLDDGEIRVAEKVDELHKEFTTECMRYAM